MPSGGGLLALIGGGKGGESSSPASAGGGAPPPSGEAEALRDMFESMQSGDFDAAAAAFRRAYDECAMRDEGDVEVEIEPKRY